jgi:hypothetical protein
MRCEKSFRPSRLRIISARFPFLVVLFVFSSPAPTRPAPAQGTAKDVVMLSLQELSPRMDLRRHLSKGLVGDTDAELDVERHLLEIQMNIVRETAKFGPVLLLVPDETTKTALARRCLEFQICELLKGDQVRVKVVVHDGL